MLTGKWYIKERKLGGFNVFVEYKYLDGMDAYDMEYHFSYRKATYKDLIEIGFSFNGTAKKR